MEDVLWFGAEVMANRSLSIIKKTLSQILNIISDRLDNASDKELIQRYIILDVGQLPELGPNYDIRFLARDLSEFLVPIGYNVELSHFKADNAKCFETISISW